MKHEQFVAEGRTARATKERILHLKKLAAAEVAGRVTTNANGALLANMVAPKTPSKGPKGKCSLYVSSNVLTGTFNSWCKEDEDDSQQRHFVRQKAKEKWHGLRGGGGGGAVARAE